MEYFTVLYNPNYGSGGINISLESFNEYLSITGEEYDYSRTNAIMATIIEKGEDCMSVAYLEIKYKDCWFIHEYDGSESVKIDIEKYRCKLIKEQLEIANKLESNDEKVKILIKIDEIISLKIKPVRVCIYREDLPIGCIVDGIQK